MTKETLTLACRSCGTTLTYAELNECDGCCKSCWAPVSLADYLAEAYEELGVLREEAARLRAQSAVTPTEPAVRLPEELRQHILHMRREVTRQDRSPLDVRQKLAQRVTELLAAPTDAARLRAVRAERHLALLEEFASQFDKPDDGEGLLEFYARTHYAQGREDGAGAAMVNPEPVAKGDLYAPGYISWIASPYGFDGRALYAEPPSARHPDDCGNCFEGKSDMEHTCRKCGGTGQALLVDALARIEAYAAPGYPSGQYRKMAREALADYRAQLGEEGT